MISAYHTHSHSLKLHYVLAEDVMFWVILLNLNYLHNSSNFIQAPISASVIVQRFIIIFKSFLFNRI